MNNLVNRLVTIGASALCEWIDGVAWVQFLIILLDNVYFKS